MRRLLLSLVFPFIITTITRAQLFVARDTIKVLENGKVLKMPWGNGLNFCNVSNVDLNLDGKKDIVAFDRINQFNVGRYRCFINVGSPGAATYTFNGSYSYAFPETSGWAIFKDYNCDGKEDIFCSTTAGIMVYTNVSYTSMAAPATLSFVLAKSLLYTDYVGTPGNLYAASNGLPGVDDIDGDGDLDIITFAPGGFLIEYHKNLTKETYNKCDSLNKFSLNTYCWGKVYENGCEFTFSQTCNPKPLTPSEREYIEKLHSGSCLTCLDSDADGDKDLLMGDISCNLIQYAHNTGNSATATIGDTTKLFPNYPNKANTTVIRLNNFPCAYMVDVDGDNVKDLVASPNTTGSENTEGMWYYRNTAPGGAVNFQFMKKTLFQEEMIDVGQNSFPILFDYDADGLKDLLVGTFGYYINGGMKSKLTLYKNTGTLTQPSYSLITRDYAGLSANNLNCIMPASGDMDGDGDIDLIIGTQDGKIFWLNNTAGPGAACNFTFNPVALFITPFAAAAPQIFDMDADGKVDLMIGGKNGRIQYYRNIGTVSNPSFTLQSNFFGGVDVKGNPNQYGNDGYAAPYFYNEGGNVRLLVGSVSGQIFYYAVPSATSNCVLLDADANNINEGAQSSVFFEDVNGDSKRDLFVGNGAGGLSFFSSKGPDVGLKQKPQSEIGVTFFPNPASGKIHVKMDKAFDSGNMELFDMTGRKVLERKILNDLETIDVGGFSRGFYLVKLSLITLGERFTHTGKVIIE